MTQQYNEDAIKVLKDHEHVRTRPLMYISSERPTYQMFTEILDNSIDEAMNGHADEIAVDIDYPSNEVRIQDNGRGLPQGENKDLKKPTPVVIYTKLNSGGKYDLQNYGKSSGLHGVGSTVVNALSEWLKVYTWRSEDVFEADFATGEEVGYTQSKDPGKTGSGTIVSFKPDKTLKLLTDNLEDYQQEIEDRLALLATIVPGLKIKYNGNMVAAKPLTDFVPTSKVKLFDDPLFFQLKDLIVSVNWAEDTNKSIYKAYCNSLYNPNGGDHERGVYDAFVDVLNHADIPLGMNFAVSVMYPGVEYDSQAKLKAVSKDMRKYVFDTLVAELKPYFKKNPDIKDEILKLAQHKRTEINKRNNKGQVRRDRKSSFLNALGQTSFSDCRTKDRSLADLYIVEGKSAAGSALQARDTETQAILPLRGKTINAHTADVVTLLKNAEIGTLVSSIDAGIFEDVVVAKSRYGKIIIMTDADEDGKDIASSLIGFFVKCMPEMIEKGYIYLALPPLYGTKVNGQFIPINDEATKNQYLAQGHKITRFKGLGEMNPDQLSVACIDKNTRNLIQITMSQGCKARVAEILGGDSEKRKELLRQVGILQ